MKRASFHAWVLSMLATLLAGLLLLAPASGPVLAQEPPPEEISELVKLLSKPEVKAWLEAQSRAQPQAEPALNLIDSSALSAALTYIEQHLNRVLSTLPRIPAQFERAWNILLVEFEEQGVLGVLALVAAFLAAGLGLDYVTRKLMAPYRSWMKQHRHDTPRGRTKNFGARLLYSFILIGVFVVGSAGAFLIFSWPPLLREVVLGYLSVGIISRLTFMLGRALLLPPHLKLATADHLRVLPMSPASATHWYFWSGWIVSWFVFVYVTFELLTTLGFDQDSLVTLGIPASVVLLVMILAAIWRRPIPALTGSGSWSPQTISWLLTVFFVVLFGLRMAGAWTAFWLTFAVVAVPGIIYLVNRAVHHTMRAPEPGTDARPFAPITITLVERAFRVTIIVAASLLLARYWGLGMTSMAQDDGFSTRLLRGGLNAAIIVLAADIGWNIVKALMEKKIAASAETGHSAGEAKAQQARMRTLLPIFQNILFAIIVVMTVLMALSAVGVQVGPLIAGAGVVGVAIGFGAQTLVKDIISGMFYLLDDAFRVGEYIDSGSYKGTVESFSLRSVKLRHHRGYLTTVPFGELGAVQNMSRDWVVEKFSISVAYDTDVDKARKIVKKIGLELAADPEFAPHVIEPLKMQGVQNFGDYGIELRIKMMTKPGEQFGMKRRAWLMIRRAFQEAGIKLAAPKIEVSGGESPAAAAAQAVLSAKDTPAPSAG